MLRRFAWALASLALSACAAETISFTPSPPPESALPSASVSVVPSPSASVLPLATPIPGVLGPGSGAQVDAIHLAVRRGPGTSFPLVAGYRLDPATNQEVLETNEVRLDAGYYAYVNQGPLVLDGTRWYQISSQKQPGEADGHPLRWDADGDGSNGDFGWVAGTTPVDTFLIPAEVPCTDPAPYCGPGVPPYAVLYATGSARSVSFDMSGGVSVQWYAADPDGGGCRMKITLRPNGIVIDSTTVIRSGHGEVIWPFDLEQGFDGEYWLDIESECTWSLVAYRLQ